MNLNNLVLSLASLLRTSSLRPVLVAGLLVALTSCDITQTTPDTAASLDTTAPPSPTTVTVDGSPATERPTSTSLSSSTAPFAVPRPTATLDALVEIPAGRMHVRCVGSGATTVLLPAELTRLTNVWNDGQQRWRTLSTDGRLVSVPDTGPHIELDQPEVVIDEISRLLP